ncbi:FtsK/SpoIIIE domain-containing protein [Streptomyces sp. NPDC007025]|uniref:FtsK/SpoIIIE domain-containing protein n=1 Tax=Streptomyces sp. NPDC007025 TaxID=3364771 RepID=UPI003684FD40
MSIDTTVRVPADAAEAATDRPPLALVKDTPAPFEGTVVEHQGQSVRPAWIESGAALAARARQHAADNRLYVGWTVRGYRQLGRRWLDARRDDYPQMIASAKAELKAASGDVSAEDSARRSLTERRAAYRLHKRWHWIKTGGWGTAGATGLATGVVTGGLWVDLALTIGTFVVGAVNGRPTPPAPEPTRGEVGPSQAPREASQLGEETMRRALVEAGIVPERRADEITGVGLPRTEGPGTAYTAELPAGIPATAALTKAEQLASALGVHRDWMDLDVDRGEGSNASRLKIWVSDQNPFDVVRPSPLLQHRGPTDTWHTGIPVSFGKRGNPISFHIRDTSLLVGGATRRGKGMFLANLLIGAAKDPWVNIRVFDGKGTAEHNPFAPLLATFVKRDPERLAVFLRGVLDDLDRRSDILDQHNLEKIDDEHYGELMRLLGGIELLVIDELATYTPKGTSKWADEITENLAQIAAVAAALGIILIDLTQVPEVDVVRGRLRQNHVGRAAVKTESGSASNTILGDGMTGEGYNAASIPINQPGRHWLSTPETGVVDARSFLVKPEEKRVAAAEAIELRREAGRLPGQWHDPIEAYLMRETGVSSAAGGERGNGRISRVTVLERLEMLAKATGRGSVTNGEVISAFAVHEPSKYARRDGESDRAYATRAGKLVKDALDAAGVELETRRVPSPDGGERSTGYTLDDIVQAGQSAK